MANAGVKRKAIVGVADHGNSAELGTIASGGSLLDRRRADLTGETQNCGGVSELRLVMDQASAGMRFVASDTPASKMPSVGLQFVSMLMTLPFAGCCREI